MSQNNTKQRSRRTYAYSCKRECLSLAIQCVIYVAIIGVASRFVEKLEEAALIKTICWIVFGLIVVCEGICILCKTKRCLKISETEVHYLSGVFVKEKISIPVSRIRSCKISTTVLQRVFGAATLSICTAGDQHEIIFEDIEQGEEAYQFIMELIQ